MHSRHWSDEEVEEHQGKRRRKQEKISVLYWFFRRNSSPPTSSRSFRTLSYWSFITGQCHYSALFLQVHLSRRMCNQFTIHHQFRIDTGRSKFEQQTDSILSACGSYVQRTQGSWHDRLGRTASCTIHADSVEETSKHGVLGRYLTCSKGKDFKCYHTRSNAIILYNTLPAYCIPKAVRMETEEIIYEKVFESPRPPPKIPLRNDCVKELVSEVARQAEGSQPNPNPIQRTGRPVVTEQTSRSSAQEIDTRFSLDCKNTNLFVERLEKDKDTDEDVDADRVRTERLVVSGQPTGSSTQLEEIDTDFTVSGLPHAVVKQSEYSRVRELEKKIESHPHRQDLQAYLQQSNACIPSSEKSKKMIRDMGNVELFELCETIPKVQCSECFFTGIQASFTALVGISWERERINPAEISSDGHWIFSQSRTMSLRRGDLLVRGMGRLKNKDNTILHIIWERGASKEVLKEFKIVSRKIQHFVNRHSALIDMKKCASRWTRTRRKISPIVCRKTSALDTKRIGGSLSIHLAKIIRWNSVQTSAKH